VDLYLHSVVHKRKLYVHNSGAVCLCRTTRCHMPLLNRCCFTTTLGLCLYLCCVHSGTQDWLFEHRRYEVPPRRILRPTADFPPASLSHENSFSRNPWHTVSILERCKAREELEGKNDVYIYVVDCRWFLVYSCSIDSNVMHLYRVYIGFQQCSIKYLFCWSLSVVGNGTLSNNTIFTKWPSEA